VGFESGQWLLMIRRRRLLGQVLSGAAISAASSLALSVEDKGWASAMQHRFRNPVFGALKPAEMLASESVLCLDHLLVTWRL